MCTAEFYILECLFSLYRRAVEGKGGGGVELERRGIFARCLCRRVEPLRHVHCSLRVFICFFLKQQLMVLMSW